MTDMSWDDDIRRRREKAEKAIKNREVFLLPESGGIDYQATKKAGKEIFYKRYAVFHGAAIGKIGHVYQLRESVAREIKGRRYVAGYRHVLRWAWTYAPAFAYSTIYRKTRHEAIRDLVERHFEHQEGE